MNRAAMFLAAALALASHDSAAQRVGDWTVEDLGDGVWAASTGNASGGHLMRVCYASSQLCVWAVTSPLQCKDGNAYVVLMNANNGANSIQTTCRAIGSLQVHVLEDYESMNLASANSTWIGFAMAAEDGAFRVSRYSLSGSKAATKAVEDAVRQTGAVRNGRDISL